MPINLAETIQKYVAISSVGPSTVRSYPTGTAKAARDFLQRTDLNKFGVDNESGLAPLSRTHLKKPIMAVEECHAGLIPDQIAALAWWTIMEMLVSIL